MIQEIEQNNRLRLKFGPYKNLKYLFYITEINIRNALLPFFASLSVKKLSFMKSKDDLIFEISENALEKSNKRYSLCVLTYHHENIGNPAYIASLLQSLKQIGKRSNVSVPFIVFADSHESLEIQFGKTSKIRAMTIRAAAKHGLKGVIIGNFEVPKTASKFVEKIIEVIEDDELSKMSTLERHLRKLVNSAYSFLNKMFGSIEEKEENINKAITLFEEVLNQSRDNCEALLGKAIACSSSSNPGKIVEGTGLFAKLEMVGDDLERIYEGHAEACHKMSELTKDNKERDKWLFKSVNSLSSLVEWQLNEYKTIRKTQYDYHDPDFIRQLSNKCSTIGASLAKIGGKHTVAAIDSYLKGIDLDPKIESNYSVVKLLEKRAKSTPDFLKLAKICSIARENLPGREIDFLISEAEAYYNAKKQHDATNLYNSVNNYITKDQIDIWARNKKNGVIPDKENSDKIAAFVTFLNHRAIYFRKIGNYENSLNDLNTAISLDAENSYFDIYFNIAKAIISAMNDGSVTGDYTKKSALNHLFTSITIAMNANLQIYEKLLKAILGDPILNPYICDIRYFLKNSNYSIPIFFK